MMDAFTVMVWVFVGMLATLIVIFCLYIIMNFILVAIQLYEKIRENIKGIKRRKYRN